MNEAVQPVRVLAASLDLWARQLGRLLPVAALCFLPWALHWISFFLRWTPFSGATTIFLGYLLRFLCLQVLMTQSATWLAGVDRPRPTLGVSLRLGVRSLVTVAAMSLLPLILVALLTYAVKQLSPTAGQLLNSVLIWVAAAVLYAFVLVAPAALALEGLNPTDAMERASRLGDGQRWRMFALLFPLCALDFGTLGLALTLVHQRTTMLAVTIGETVLVGSFNAALCVVFYRALHQRSEGTPPAEVAEVFA